MITTLTGANDFARSHELHKLVQSFIDEHTDMAVERFDGEEVSMERMRESLQSLPFLTPRKLVILREPSKQKAFTENIENILTGVAETTDVIIVEPKLDKRLSYYKLLKEMTGFQDFIDLDGSGLAKWAQNYVSEKGGTISQIDARALIDRVGGNQQMLQNELDKLVAFSSTVTKETIELLTDRLPQSTVFELLDAAFAGKLDRTMALYAEQRALKVEPQAILAMLAWQLHILVVVKAGASRPADEIAKGAKLNPFVVRKSQGLVKSLTITRLRELVAELLQLDKRLKRSSVDADEAVQLFLINVAIQKK